MKASFTLLFISAMCAMMAQAKPIERVSSGKANYYHVGVGSCGIKNVDTDYVVALPHSVMGKKSNSSYCGKTVVVKKGSTTVNAKVVDTCASCKPNDIVLSPAAFKKLGRLNKGVVNVTWSLK